MVFACRATAPVLQSEYRMAARKNPRPLVDCQAVLRIALLVALILSPARGFPNQAVGIVVATGKAQVGSVSATPGATVFSGDLLATQGGGGLLVQAGKFRFFLNENSVASIYEQPAGLAIELVRGSLVFSSATPDAGVQLFASDVRIAPQAGQSVMGEIRFVSACELRVTSQTGSLQVSKEKQSFTAGAGSSYKVVPGHALESRTPRLSPSDPRIHDSHTHVKCEPLPVVKQPPLNSPSWFAPVMFVEAAVVAAVLLAYWDSTPVSPHR